MFQTKVEKVWTDILFSSTFFENRGFLDNVEKCSGAGQTKDGTMAHAHCMLDTQGYKQLGICNTYFFSTTTMVAQTHLGVTFTVLCIMYSGILRHNINNIQANPTGCLSLVSAVCWQVEVSAMCPSPTECGVSECDRKTSTLRRPWSTRGCRTI